MSTRTKRTYNLSAETVAHVRDLAQHGQFAASQDGIVELAIERLYRDAGEQAEVELWSRAATDDEFQSEIKGIAAEYRDLDTWPA